MVLDGVNVPKAVVQMMADLTVFRLLIDLMVQLTEVYLVSTKSESKVLTKVHLSIER